MDDEPRTFSCAMIGDESLLIRCAKIVIEAGHELRAISSADSRIIAWASENSTLHVTPEGDLASKLSEIEFDYLFSIANLRMLPAELLRLPRKAAINFHDGPLPAYAGMYAPAWAIIRGESEHGITFHEMTAEADAGSIYRQEFFELVPQETSLTLNARCYEAAMESFAELVELLSRGAVKPLPQEMEKRSYFARLDRPEAALSIDFRKPAIESERLVRATDFGRHENAFGSAKLVHRGPVFRVVAASCCEGESSPGTILEINEASLVVGTGDGALSIVGTCRRRSFGSCWIAPAPGTAPPAFPCGWVDFADAVDPQDADVVSRA